jgi:hypothetical protein
MCCALCSSEHHRPYTRDVTWQAVGLESSALRAAAEEEAARVAADNEDGLGEERRSAVLAEAEAAMSGKSHVCLPRWQWLSVALGWQMFGCLRVSRHRSMAFLIRQHQHVCPWSCFRGSVLHSVSFSMKGRKGRLQCRCKDAEV